VHVGRRADRALDGGDDGWMIVDDGDADRPVERGFVDDRLSLPYVEAA
jgi:hypothetical protein